VRIKNCVKNQKATPLRRWLKINETISVAIMQKIEFLIAFHLSFSALHLPLEIFHSSIINGAPAKSNKINI